MRFQYLFVSAAMSTTDDSDSASAPDTAAAAAFAPPSPDHGDDDLSPVSSIATEETTVTEESEEYLSPLSSLPPSPEEEAAPSPPRSPSPVPDPVPIALEKHLERQGKILKNLGASPAEADALGAFLEKNLFTPAARPDKSTTSEGADPRLNFYPPFLVPECLALHFPFFVSTAVPMSCKANRVGSETYKSWEELDRLPDEFPNAQNGWTDALGKVKTMAELKENQKLALLEQDGTRLRWMKLKSQGLANFAYPALQLPPPVQQMLLEAFVGTRQEPNKIDGPYVPSLTAQTLRAADEPPLTQDQVKERRELLGAAATFGVPLLAMQGFFTSSTLIKNLQESLHHTFLHGFVRLVKLLAEADLSQFVTYHGLTYRNRLNNPTLHRNLEGADRVDYVVDTIYLFLVYTWQTAMDVWGQALDEATLEAIKERIEAVKPLVVRDTYEEACVKILGAVFPPLLREALVVNLPDFVNQTQLNNFRHFINAKAGIPSSVCPAMPTDFIPLEFKEAHPILHPHVFLLRMASYLKNHGDYCNPADQVTLSSCLCECNLCSPHRMPCYNPALMQEITCIGQIEVQKGSESSFSFTPQVFCDAYLKKFEESDFYFDRVIRYSPGAGAFTAPLSACVVRDPRLLAVFHEAQKRREENLMKRGCGLYKDTQTGEVLGRGGTPWSARQEIEEQESGDGGGETVSSPFAKPNYGSRAPRALRGIEEEHGEQRGLAAQPDPERGRGEPPQRGRGRGGRGGGGGGSRANAPDGYPTGTQRRRNRRKGKNPTQHGGGGQQGPEEGQSGGGSDKENKDPAAAPAGAGP
nr:100K [Bearded dragon adenovirus 1]